MTYNDDTITIDDTYDAPFAVLSEEPVERLRERRAHHLARARARGRRGVSSSSVGPSAVRRAVVGRSAGDAIVRRPSVVGVGGESARLASDLVRRRRARNNAARSAAPRTRASRRAHTPVRVAPQIWSAALLSNVAFSLFAVRAGGGVGALRWRWNDSSERA